MTIARRLVHALVAAGIGLGAAASAQAGGIRITEWMYNEDEFIEFTNLGASAIDMTGWSFDDDSRTAGVVDLSAFGTVASGESVILAEADAAEFRARWGLDAGVRIIGGNATNLGRQDEINIYDASDALVDRLTYGDNTIGGPRTQGTSGIPNAPSVVGINDVTKWKFSVAGQEGAIEASGFVASPGFTTLQPVPEPETYALMAVGLAMLGLAARRRRSTRRAVAQA